MLIRQKQSEPAPGRERAPKAAPVAGPQMAMAQRLQITVGNRATTSLLRGGAVVVQRQGDATKPLGLHNRTWETIGETQRLKDKSVFRLSGTQGGEIVVKLYKARDMEDPTSGENPAYEALAAGLGNIAAFQTKTAGTVLLEISSPEGKEFAEGTRHTPLAAGLSQYTWVAVMESVAGTDATDSGGSVSRDDPQEQAETFRQLGRMWAFDRVIGNTDRNLGNIMVGTQGAITGIDQSTAISFRQGLPPEVGEPIAEKIMSEVASLNHANAPIDGLLKALGLGHSEARKALGQQFKIGALTALDGVALLEPADYDREVRETVAKLPEAARRVIGESSLQGLAAIQARLTGSRNELREQKEAAIVEGRADTATQAVWHVRTRIIGELTKALAALEATSAKAERSRVFRDTPWRTDETSQQFSILQSFGLSDFTAAKKSVTMPAGQAGALVADRLKTWEDKLNVFWSTARTAQEQAKRKHPETSRLVLALRTVLPAND